MNAPWLEAAKNRPVAEIVVALGGWWRRDRLGPCPACGAESERHVRRLPVGILRGGDAWKCNVCGVFGDGLDLVAYALTKKPCSALNQEEWRNLKTWFGEGTYTQPMARIPPPPAYPPPQKILEFWEECQRIAGDLLADPSRRLPPPQKNLQTWLRSRGLEPQRVSVLDLVRISPPRTATGLEVPGDPWWAVLPMFDETGAHRSLVFRATTDTLPQKMPVKSRALTGYSRAGLVLAEPMARALLSRHEDDEPIRVVSENHAAVYWSGVLHICEGEPDFLTLSTHPSRAFFVNETPQQKKSTYAVLAHVGADGLPEAVARRIPATAEVHLWPHQDKNGAGEAAVARTIRRLPPQQMIVKRRLNLV